MPQAGMEIELNTMPSGKSDNTNSTNSTITSLEIEYENESNIPSDANGGTASKSRKKNGYTSMAFTNSFASDGTDGKKKSLEMGNDEEPSRAIIHGALWIAQVIFGCSAVVGTIGLPSFHPLTFALYRESSATFILLTVAHFTSLYCGRPEGILSGSRKDLPMILLAGTGIFASQACYIIGIKLSSAVAASVWQPTQPVFTSAVCMLLGWEPYNGIRVMGILIAFIGCAVMVMGGGGGGGEAIGGAAVDEGEFANFIGQIAFLLGCLGSSVYVLASKCIIKTGRYECIAVTAWSYTTASIMMAALSWMMSWSRGVSHFLCRDCDLDHLWQVPRSAIPAIAFFVIMTSTVSYGLITWANKYATGTLVIGYTVMQPVASAIMIQLLISFGLYQSCNITDLTRFLQEGISKTCLDQPDIYTAMGALGVFLGLFLIVKTEPDTEDTKSEDETTQIEGESLLESEEDTSRYIYDDDDDLASLEGQK